MNDLLNAFGRGACRTQLPINVYTLGFCVMFGLNIFSRAAIGLPINVYTMGFGVMFGLNILSQAAFGLRVKLLQRKTSKALLQVVRLPLNASVTRKEKLEIRRVWPACTL